MWNILIDNLLGIQSSLSIILQNWHLFLCLLVIPSAFGLSVVCFFSDTLIDQSSLVILSYLGGILGFSLFSLSVVFLRIKPSPILGIIFFFAALLVLVWNKQRLRILIFPNLIWLAIFSLFILLLRLIFIQDLIVPPYADSVEHLQIVKDFLNPKSPPQAFYRLSFDLGRYYHFGFHALAAWLSGTTNTTPEKTILLLGQYFQTVAVFGIYPLARIITKNSFSAWTLIGIAGLLLPIPAYASNWGKYPAIASLTGISFVLTLIAIYVRNKSTLSKNFWWLVGFAVLSTTFLHSRSIFVFLLVACLTILYFKYDIFPKEYKINESNIKYTTMSALILIVLLFIYTMLLEIQVSILLIFLFLELAILALFADFVLNSAIILFVLITGASLLFPLLLQFNLYKTNTIFDRPYLVIIFYLPASFLLWGGLDGYIRLFIYHKIKLGRRYVLVSILTIGMVNAFFIQDHRPSNCCIFINNDDLFSFEWLKKNIPQGAIVGIAATGAPGNFLSADGGAWIEPMIGIPTRKLDSNADFLTETWKLCSDNVTYFYMDNLENSFDEYNLIDAGGVYQFGLGRVHIYRLECDFLK